MVAWPSQGRVAQADGALEGEPSSPWVATRNEPTNCLPMGDSGQRPGGRHYPGLDTMRASSV